MPGLSLERFEETPDVQFFEMTTLQEKLELIPMPFRFSEDEV
jgi:hypothetical protein